MSVSETKEDIHMQEKTLEDLVPEYLNSLRENGKSERTLYTYGKDGEQITAFFGPERKLVNILPVHVGKFHKSDELLRTSKGKDRAPATINKTRRVFKAMMIYALEKGYIETAPFSKVNK